MNIEILKNKIIEKNIISKEDMPNASKDHIMLATFFLFMSENLEYEDDVNNFEIEKLHEEVEKIQDLLELQNFDKVEDNKSFESTGKIKMGIPKNIIPFLRNEIIPEMIQELSE